MYSVLIVEDEAYIRQGLITKLKSLNLPIESYYEAVDAEEGIEIFKCVMPDILITDIRLNGADGLVLLSEVKRYNPNIQTIIVSGYPQFDYAQRAIELSVGSYLLKPISANTLKKHVSNAISSLAEAKARASSLHELESKVGSLSAVNAVSRLLFLKDIPPAQRDSLAKELPSCSSFVLGILVVDKFSFDKSVFNHQEYNLAIYALKNIISDYKTDDLVLVFDNNRHALYLLFGSTDEDGGEALPARAREYCLSLIGMVKRILRLEPAFALSDKSTTVSSELYTVAHNKLEQRHFGDSAEANRLLQTAGDKKIDVEQVFEPLVFCLRKMDVCRLENEVLRFLPDGLTVASYRERIKGLSRALQNLAPEFNTTVQICAKLETVADSVTDVFSTEEEIRRFVTSKLLDLVDIEAYNTAKYSHKIVLAKRYIQIHFKEPLTVNALAEQYDMNTSYLSMLFKKEAGVSVVSYLTQIRMEYAKQLMLSSDISSTKIGEMVGYENAHYFYKVFKKSFHCTPAEFRAKNIK